MRLEFTLLGLVLLNFAYGENLPFCKGDNRFITDINDCNSDKDCMSSDYCCRSEAGSTLCSTPICEECIKDELKNCKFGQADKVEGCKPCKCKEDPCKTLQCRENEKCITYLRNYPEGIVGKCVSEKMQAVCYENKRQPPKLNSPLWYYDIEKGGCFKATNFQNCEIKTFSSAAECQMTCDVKCAVPMCTRDCPHGFELSEFGCETCDCKKKTRSCEPLTCSSECTAGYKVDRYGCQTCDCKEVTNPKYCYEPLDPGDCDTYDIRFYYNKYTGKCEQFKYKGCNGNANNFFTMEECQRKCDTDSCPLPNCASNCKYGMAYTEKGCQTCTCIDGSECKGITCAENYVCVALDTEDFPNFSCQPQHRVSPSTVCKGKKWRIPICIGVGAGVLILMIVATIIIVKKVRKPKIATTNQSSKPEKPPIDTPNNVVIEAPPSYDAPPSYEENEKKVPLA